MAVMRCYVLSNNNVEHLEQSRFLDARLHLPKKFGTTQKERSIIWQRLKGQLESQVDVKKEDQIIYVTHSLNQETNDFSSSETTFHYLCFSTGNGKKDTLKRIFIKAEEEEKEENLYKWDLSDESISINEHIKAIHEKKEVKNEFTAKQSDQLLYKLVNNNVAKCVNNKDWNGLIRALVFNLKSLKEVFKYSKYDSLSIIQLLRDLQTQIEDPKFLDRLKKSKDLPYFDGSILFNIDNL